MKASDNPFPSVLVTEGTEPSAPAAGKQRLYIDSTTHKLKRTDSSGTDVTIESGDVATDVIWDTKGDLAVGTGANTAQKLVVGANGTIAMADSTQTTGIKWATLSVGTASFEVATTLLNSVLSGTQTTFSVSSVAAGSYDYIEIELASRSSSVASADDAILMSFNSDTTNANYRSARSLGGSAIFNADGDTRNIGIAETAFAAGTAFATTRIVITNPSAAQHKTSIATSVDRQSATVLYTVMLAHRWESTSAVDGIVLSLSSGSDFAAGSQCLIKGFKSQTLVTSVSIG